eukprot:scaffold488123_cov33-Prasinocladus_malaysianus.AAC.1
MRMRGPQSLGRLRTNPCAPHVQSLEARQANKAPHAPLGQGRQRPKQAGGLAAACVCRADGILNGQEPQAWQSRSYQKRNVPQVQTARQAEAGEVGKPLEDGRRP